MLRFFASARPLLARAVRALGVAAAGALLVGSLAGCATMNDRPQLPPGVDPAHVHFHDPVAAPGQPAPDFTLTDVRTFSQVTLSELRGRPTVLIFGSCT